MIVCFFWLLEMSASCLYLLLTTMDWEPFCSLAPLLNIEGDRWSCVQSQGCFRVRFPIPLPVIPCTSKDKNPARSKEQTMVYCVVSHSLLATTSRCSKINRSKQRPTTTRTTTFLEERSNRDLICSTIRMIQHRVVR